MPLFYGTARYHSKWKVMDSPESPPPTLKDRILCAAFEAFMTNGYAGTSTLAIARLAKVSKRDLYATFNSKQAMLAAAIADRADHMRMPLSLPPPRDPATFTATLVAFGSALLWGVSQPEVLATYRLAILESERAPDVARTLDDMGWRTTSACLADFLAGAQYAGLIGAGPPAELADTFAALLWKGGLPTRLLLRVVPAPGPDDIDQRARSAVAGLLKLYPVESPGR